MSWSGSFDGIDGPSATPSCLPIADSLRDIRGHLDAVGLADSNLERSPRVRLLPGGCRARGSVRPESLRTAWIGMTSRTRLTSVGACSCSCTCRVVPHSTRGDRYVRAAPASRRRSRRRCEESPIGLSAGRSRDRPVRSMNLVPPVLQPARSSFPSPAARTGFTPSWRHRPRQRANRQTLPRPRPDRVHPERRRSFAGRAHSRRWLHPRGAGPPGRDPES